MHRKNVFLGSILLVAGCCIGAGMLGLPMAILSFGFLPSLLPLFFAWAYMNVSGCMLLECSQGLNEDVHLMGLFEKTLGRWGKIACFILFAILFYSLLTAYISGTSIIITDAISQLFQINFSQTLGIFLVSTLLFFGIVFGVGEVDWLNRLFIFIMFGAYIALMAFGLFQIDFENYSSISFNRQFFFSLPLFIISFGFQNLIPTLSGYLNRDKRKIFLSFFIGSAIALFLYLFFNFVIVGLITKGATFSGSEEEFITRLFKHSPVLISLLVSVFSFFAIITSLLSIAVSFVGFLSDTTKGDKNPVFYTLGVVIPPLCFALFNPNIFLLALRYGGGCSAVLLFGVLPTLALWKMRYGSSLNLQDKIVPGGKFALILYLLFSFGIVGIDLYS